MDKTRSLSSSLDQHSQRSSPSESEQIYLTNAQHNLYRNLSKTPMTSSYPEGTESPKTWLLNRCIFHLYCYDVVFNIQSGLTLFFSCVIDISYTVSSPGIPMRAKGCSGSICIACLHSHDGY